MNEFNEECKEHEPVH